MSAPFQAGDKAVLIDDNWPPEALTRFVTLPVRDAVYCVAGCEQSIDTFGHPIPNAWSVHLVGFESAMSHPSGHPYGFWHIRLRRVWTQSTSVTTSADATIERGATS